MADTVEQQNIRGLDIDKTIKGFALVSYDFMNDCEVTPTTGDSIRWYTETAADLTATAPSVNANISPLSVFPTLEASWTRNTSYPRKYGNECFISMEDIATADIDVLSRQLLRLARAVTKQVDSRIQTVMNAGFVSTQASALTAANTINGVQTNQPWNVASYTGVDIIEDIMDAKLKIYQANYNPEGATLWLSPTDHKNMLAWLVGSKGSSIPTFSSARMQDGVVMNLLGVNVKVSNNVTASGALLVVPKVACTWKSVFGLTTNTEDVAGIGKRVKAWQMGEAILTDPLAVTLIYGTQT